MGGPHDRNHHVGEPERSDSSAADPDGRIRMDLRMVFGYAVAGEAAGGRYVGSGL